jgi:hypothetical protein
MPPAAPGNDEAWVRTLLACFCARAKARLQVRIQEFSEELYMSSRRRPETMRRRLVVTTSVVLSGARNDSSRHYELILGGVVHGAGRRPEPMKRRFANG